MKLRNDQIRQVAFIRVGALGDMMVGTAAIYETHLLFPDASIWVVGHRQWLELLEPGYWPWCTGIIVIEGIRDVTGTLYTIVDNEWVATGPTAPLRHFYRHVQAVVNTRYESPRYAWGPFFSRVAIRYGASQRYYRWLHTHWTEYPRRGPTMHERDMVLSIIGRTPAGPGLPRLKHDNAVNATLITECKPKSYWLVNPTASSPVKTWPAERFCELLRRLTTVLSSRNIVPLVIGSPHETPWLRDVARDTCAIVQPQRLSDLMDVVSSAGLLITGASSMQFFAAATGIPTITLFGDANPSVWGPLGPDDLIVRGVPSEGELTAAQREAKAFETISVDSVEAAALPFLNRL